MAIARSAGGEREILKRIVALLLAMAELAERAAGATGFARREVLWALQQADLVTKDYIAGIVCGPADRHWSPALPRVRYGNAPADALTMASALRALALAVQMMATLMRRAWVGAADDGHAHGHSRTGDTQITQPFLATTARIERRDTS